MAGYATINDVLTKHFVLWFWIFGCWNHTNVLLSTSDTLAAVLCVKHNKHATEPHIKLDQTTYKIGPNSWPTLLKPEICQMLMALGIIQCVYVCVWHVWCVRVLASLCVWLDVGYSDWFGQKPWPPLLTCEFGIDDSWWSPVWVAPDQGWGTNHMKRTVNPWCSFLVEVSFIWYLVPLFWLCKFSCCSCADICWCTQPHESGKKHQAKSTLIRQTRWTFLWKKHSFEYLLRSFGFLLLSCNTILAKM